MQIRIHADRNEFADQARAYAEYKIFSGVRRLTRAIDRIDVELLKTHAADETFRCSVRLTMTSGRAASVEACAAHPYTAIDEAARQVAGSLDELTSERFVDPVARSLR